MLREFLRSRLRATVLLNTKKGYKQAAVIELPYNPDVVAKSIKDNMLKKGIKEEKPRVSRFIKE